ncbi:hypothetical protein [Streptomyces sp. NBC_00233]|uniref:hypothetical protein n=1 Tax=Streptomyces sp. NBC_00233 TaxID=2975686 RepID=UPI0022588E6C|nr:hypothetical protein [Streptomyces sp. NBC_00233]MCX5229707.1 hypothetical protein [Streptomyces sp. NBC_00233]
MSSYRTPVFIATQGLARFVGALDDERQAQLAKWGEQKHPDGAGRAGYIEKAGIARDACLMDALVNDGGPRWSLILLEEVYEALAEEDLVRLRAELVQVAAVAAAWVRDIDTRPHPMICAHCGQPIPVDPNGHTWHGPVPLPGQPYSTVPRYHLGVEYPKCRKAGR